MTRWPERTVTERFWIYVEKSEDCWLWTGGRSSRGYGRFHFGMPRRSVQAHRFAFEEERGSIPAGLTIDHLCRVRNCVNPDHLEVVTGRENTIRGNGATAMNARKTHCKYGHEFTVANTYHPRHGGRECRSCHARSAREWRALKSRERAA